MEDPPSDAATEDSLVPIPADAVHAASSDVVVITDSDDDGEIQGHHDIMEFFPPPRVIVEAVNMKLHLRGEYTFDIETSGHDFRRPKDKVLGRRLMLLHKVRMACLSPPCTMFSDLWNMWNVQRCDPAVYHER